MQWPTERTDCNFINTSADMTVVYLHMYHLKYKNVSIKRKDAVRDKKKVRDRDTKYPDRDLGQAIQTNLPHCLSCMVFCPSPQPTLSAPTADSCHSATQITQVHILFIVLVAFEWQVWGKKEKKNHCHKYHINKERMIQARRETKTEEAENMMEDRINSVSEMCGGCCVRVWEVLAINRFIYASSVQKPNTRLLGSDSEYSSIKRSSDTRLTQTHMYYEFVNHTLMYSQSQRPVTSAQRGVHTHSTCHVCKSCKRQKREAVNDLKSPYSTTDQKPPLVFEFVSSNNLAGTLQR